VRELEAELEQTDEVAVLVAAIDRLFLARLMNTRRADGDEGIAAMVRSMVAQRGCGSVREVASAFAYSEKQLRRLFVRQVGTSPKLFARIVRANHALHLLQKQPATLIEVAIDAGFYDQAHFIHDFLSICGLTPQEYRRRMSVFYNDGTKM
jgi:AraC-like DNA-binding protein